MIDDGQNDAVERGRKYLLDAGKIEPKGGQFALNATDINGTPVGGTFGRLNVAGASVELHAEMEVQGFLALAVDNRLYLDPRDLSWVKVR